MRRFDRLSTRGILLGVLSVIGLTTHTYAGPINTDVAFTPYKGGSILRLQWRYEEADGRGAVQHKNVSVSRAAWIYGVNPNLALIVNVPYVSARVDRFAPKLGRFEVKRDGLADITALLKLRIWQEDIGPLQTRRAAILAGMNVRSGDSDFSSDSYDPMLGAVYSYREDRNVFDADILYQLNTAGGEGRHDVIRYDVSYSYRVFPAVFEEDMLEELQLVAELNGSYTTSGDHEVFIAPGLQYTTERWTWELSLQIPTVQEFKGVTADTNYRLVLGLRYRW
jgi:Putative MetA-pathway of phenol degradation